MRTRSSRPMYVFSKLDFSVVLRTAVSTVVPVKSKFEWAFVPSCHVNTGSSTWFWNCFAWRARRGGNSVFRLLWLLFWSVDNASHGFPACLVETECFQALEVAETCEQNSHGICIGVADVICFRLWSWRHSALVNKTTCICKRLFSPPRVARLETQGALLILRRLPVLPPYTLRNRCSHRDPSQLATIGEEQRRTSRRKSTMVGTSSALLGQESPRGSYLLCLLLLLIMVSELCLASLTGPMSLLCTANCA